MNNFSRLSDRVLKMQSAVNENAHLACRDSAEKTAQRARAACPKRSGRLRQSIRAEDLGLSCYVTTNVPYAVYIEKRTRFLSSSADREEFFALMKRAVK